MIQFNLLPDVKLEYIKAARTKRLVISAAVLVSAAVAGIVLLLVMNVMVVQRQHLNNLNSDIADHTAELTGTEDINKVLTIQSQLGRLTDLHDGKPAATRLFDHISQITPASVVFSEFAITFAEEGTEEGTEQHSISITGQSPNMEVVNKFVDTLKFTTIQGEDKNAFSEVVLMEFARAEDGTVSYMISLKFDPDLFDGTKDTKIVVPKLTTTRSAVEKPGALFIEKEQEQGAQ
ncbi:hypothetical protein BH23PAT1_BH23PAT1_1200 [soil metagenome]